MEDQHLPQEHTKLAVPVVRMSEFWSHAATYWFLVLEAQLKVHKIDRQDLQDAILTQWLTKKIAISVSDVLIGPMAILHSTTRANNPNSTNQTYREPHFKDAHPFSYACIRNRCTQRNWRLFPNSRASASYPPYRSPLTPCAVQPHNEISQLCSLAASAESKPLAKIPIVYTSTSCHVVTCVKSID